MVIHFIRWARKCCQLPPPSLARSVSGVQAASTPSFLGPAEGLSGPWTVFSWKRLEASTGGNRRPLTPESGGLVTSAHAGHMAKPTWPKLVSAVESIRSPLAGLVGRESEGQGTWATPSTPCVSDFIRALPAGWGWGREGVTVKVCVRAQMHPERSCAPRQPARRLTMLPHAEKA